jgi:hypothetical protein
MIKILYRVTGDLQYLEVADVIIVYKRLCMPTSRLIGCGYGGLNVHERLDLCFPHFSYFGEGGKLFAVQSIK